MRCTDGRGITCDHAAEGWLIAPEGRRIQAMCRVHALACIREYAEQLDEGWTFSATDADRCRAGLCDSGYPCPLHALAPSMLGALRALVSERADDAERLRIRAEARAILREMDA